MASSSAPEALSQVAILQILYLGLSGRDDQYMMEGTESLVIGWLLFSYVNFDHWHGKGP